MVFNKTLIEGVYEIKLSPFKDDRGEFSRIYSGEELKEIGINKPITHVNHSLTLNKGTLRGIHFQHPPHSENKLIRCIKGKVFDVAVDLRVHSKTFLKWVSIILSPWDYNMIVIPEGCAHGFQTLEDDCELIYFHTASYNAESEGALKYDDPFLNIQWPLPAINVSQRDLNHPFLDANFTGIKLSTQ